MNEENQTAKVKKGGKAKKIVIAIIAVVIIIAIVIGVLLATGVLDINLSKKSKMAAGIEKLGEAFTDPLENISEMTEKNGNDIKILENLQTDSAKEFSIDLSAKVDEFKMDSLSSSEESTVKSIVDLIGKSQLGLGFKFDGKDSVYAKLNGKIDDVELSGEVLYDGSQLGMRSEEVNSKWLVLKEDDLKDLVKESGVETEDVQKIINTAKEQTEKIMESTNIDEKTQKEIQERYSDVLKDYINSKSKEIEQETDKVEVDGKEKRCKKLSLELKDNDIKDLLKEYVKTFKDDKELKKIIEDTMNSYIEIAKEAGAEDEAEEMQKAIKELYDNIDEINKAIDEIEFEGSIELVVYATSTKVYRTDIIVEIEDTKVKVETTFNKKSTVMEINASNSGVTVEIGKLTLTEKENGINLKIEPSEMMKKSIGVDFTCEIDYTQEDKNSELTIKVDADDKGRGTVTLKSNIEKNEEKEYKDKSEIIVDIDIPEMITAKMSLTMNTKMNVGNVSLPTISNSDAVDITDNDAVEEYRKDAQEQIEELTDKLEKIDGLESLLEDAIDAFNISNNGILEESKTAKDNTAKSAAQDDLSSALATLSADYYANETEGELISVLTQEALEKEMIGYTCIVDGKNITLKDNSGNTFQAQISDYLTIKEFAMIDGGTQNDEELF